MRQHREKLVLLPVRDAQCVFGVAPLGDVDGRADVALELAVVTEPRRRVGAHPAVLAVVTSKTKFGREARLRRERASIGVQVLIAIVRVHESTPVVTAHFVVGLDADELEIGTVDELAAFEAVDPEQHRRALGQRREPLLAVA